MNDIYRCGKSSVETMELKGYELVKELFVDNSGFGLDDELALTQNQFKKELENLLKEHGQLTAKITNAGQFQVYIGLFKKTKKTHIKNISKNVFTYLKNNRVIVRLYDTDIVELNDYEGKIKLFSGGYQTRTTAKWINKYLPNGVRVYQRDFTWYVEDSRTTPSTIRGFQEGIEISI